MSPVELGAAISALLAGLCVAHPDCIRAVYLDGSQADGSAVATSDIDLTIIVADVCSHADRDALGAMTRAIGMDQSIELDAEITDEAGLAHGVSPMLKEASRLVWGEPIVARLPLMPLDAWTRDRMHSSYWRTASLFGRGGHLSLPLDYPTLATSSMDSAFAACAVRMAILYPPRATSSATSAGPRPP